MVDLFLRSYKLLSHPQVLGVTIESLVTATILDHRAPDTVLSSLTALFLTALDETKPILQMQKLRHKKSGI